MGENRMTSNNEYYQSILNTVSGETITTYETTLNLMKRICLAYGCTYSSAQCSNQYLKDFAEASIGTTYSENKLNIEYLHDIALNFYPLTDEGTENYYLGIIADYITVTPKLYTDLTIDVPLVLVYSDEFDITGVLTDENDDPVENANISLLVGNTIVDTATTDSTGTVEFTQAPVSMGNHTFQLIFNGNSECYSTSSSTVSRTINKETSVLNVSLPLDGANYYDYENIAVTGTLYDNDGELIDNATVKVYNSSTLLESVNVSNGSFSISNLTDIAGTLGDYTLTIIYEGNDYYTASSVTRTIHIVEEILYDDLTLTSTESILSYYDSEYVDLTAQLTYEGSDVALSGVAIDFYVDNVLVDSVDTNNSGRSVYRYNSTGAGDVTIEAKIGTSVSETYGIEDCIYYSALTDNSKESHWTIPSSLRNSTFGYNTNGWKFGNNSSYITIPLNIQQFNTVSIEMIITESSGVPNPIIEIGGVNVNYNNNTRVWGIGGTNVTHTIDHSAVYRVEVSTTGLSLYEDDVLIGQGSAPSTFPYDFGMGTGSNRYCRIKDLKIKPL